MNYFSKYMFLEQIKNRGKTRRWQGNNFETFPENLTALLTGGIFQVTAGIMQHLLIDKWSLLTSNFISHKHLKCQYPLFQCKWNIIFLLLLIIQTCYRANKVSLRDKCNAKNISVLKKTVKWNSSKIKRPLRAEVLFEN